MAYSRRTTRRPARRSSVSRSRSSYSRSSTYRKAAARSGPRRRSSTKRAGSRAQTVRIVVEHTTPNAVARPMIAAEAYADTKKARF